MMKTFRSFLENKRSRALVLAGLTVLVAASVAAGISLAKTPAMVAAEPSPMHPAYTLLDIDGNKVIESGKPLSTSTTCGACHDTSYIATHSFHSDLGLSDYKPGAGIDSSNGLFGKWDPISYRYLSQDGDQVTDLGTADWIRLNASRLVGGGPAEFSRNGQPLASGQGLLAIDKAATDPKSGKAQQWNWQSSGSLEMDCFLCHTATPNTTERTAEITSGHFSSASTATLVGSGLVTRDGDTFAWNKDAFNEDGSLKKELVTIQEPTNQNCAACHGEVHPEVDQPVTIKACDSTSPLTQTTGQVIAGQKIPESGVNVAGKAEANRPWDIHAERALKCTDCHYSINNPIHSQEAPGSMPSHLVYDPRKMTIGEYLKSPSHNFARGQSAQYNTDPENKGTMRRCESCHNAAAVHEDWLPYSSQHMAVLACESCHIPKMYAPALQMVDWTFIRKDGSANSTCRGINGVDTVKDLVSGFKPVLMQRQNIDGSKSLTPYNLVSSWYWVYQDVNGNERPVPQSALKQVFLKNGEYAADILNAFDQNGDGTLQADETRVTTDSQVNLIGAKLEEAGFPMASIKGTVQPYSINHDVAAGEFAVSQCSECHSSGSRVGTGMALAAYVPGGVTPQFAQDTNVISSGDLVVAADGSLAYKPVNLKDGIYIFGKDAQSIVDWFGAIVLLLAVFGVAGHGTIRYIAAMRTKRPAPQTKPVYIYQAYERFWHWLQAISILALVLTGLVIHRPDMFGAFSFRGIVIVHNVFAAITVINAALSLFWHLTTGEIKQYIPRPVGFFDDAIVQAKYYMSGIFKGEPHPFEKKRQQKMNPLQQATYFGLLNVLLPLQIISGALMWSVQKWPVLVTYVGGLANVAIFHSLVAWLLGSFIIGHIYLTTTGATPLEAMRGMVTGWEELETHEHSDKKK